MPFFWEAVGSTKVTESKNHRIEFPDPEKKTYQQKITALLFGIQEYLDSNDGYFFVDCVFFHVF